MNTVVQVSVTLTGIRCEYSCAGQRAGGEEADGGERQTQAGHRGLEKAAAGEREEKRR